MKTYIPLNGLSGAAIAVLPSIICIQLTFSDGLGGGISVYLYRYFETTLN